MPARPGDVAAITGASSGIGAALAPLLAAKGHPVALIARRDTLLNQIASQIQARGGQAIAISADVADSASVATAFQQVEARLGPVSMLVANAGLSLPTPAHPFRADHAERLIQVNYLGVLRCIDAVLPGMLERRHGHIVGISSLAAYRGFPVSAGYCASKAALSTFLEGLRADLLDTGVHVTTAHPGYIQTPMTDALNRPLPLLMDVNQAAQILARGIENGRRQVNFPWRAALFMRLVRSLPGPLFDLVARIYGSRNSGDSPPPQNPGGQPRTI